MAKRCELVASRVARYMLYFGAGKGSIIRKQMHILRLAVVTSAQHGMQSAVFSHGNAMSLKTFASFYRFCRRRCVYKVMSCGIAEDHGRCHVI